MTNTEVFTHNGEVLSAAEVKYYHDDTIQRLKRVEFEDTKFNLTQKIGLTEENDNTDIVLFRRYVAQLLLSHEIIQKRDAPTKLEKVKNTIYFSLGLELLNQYTLNHLNTLKRFMEDETNQYIGNNYHPSDQKPLRLRLAVNELCSKNMSANPRDIINPDRNKQSDSWITKWNTIFTAGKAARQVISTRE